MKTVSSRSFKDLDVWKRSMELTQRVYELTSRFPDEEKYSLASQMRRCTVSIPSNIAEGSKRGCSKEFTNFLRIASGSAAELETQLLVAKNIYSRLDYEEVCTLLDEVQRMLYKLLQSINKGGGATDEKQKTKN